jgi:hypothetical protein
VGITARGVAVFCGVLLGGFGLLGLFVAPRGLGEINYLLASWLLPITLVPGAALASALDPVIPRTAAAQARSMWPAYVGLPLYGAVTGARWYDASLRATPGNYIPVFMVVVLAVHAVLLLGVGAVLALFPRTRPAGIQMWIGYAVLIASWALGVLAR